MTKSKKNLAVIVALITLLVALGSLFAIFGIFAKPTKMVEAAELTEAQLAERRANPGLYETGTMTLKKSWQQLLDDGDIAKRKSLIDDGFELKNTNLEGDLVCGEFEGITSFRFNFSDCSNLTSVDLSNLDTSQVTNMSCMFGECSSLTSVVFGDNFDTSNVTDMSSMFSGCSSLTTIDLDNFNTKNVVYMQAMFQSCKSLVSLDVSGFDTRSATDIGFMFSGCKKLTSIDVSNFDTSKVTSMGAMFQSCSSLTSLDVGNFDTSKVTDMGNMFAFCSKIQKLDLSNFNTSNVTDMNGMFQGISSVKSLDLSGFDTSKVTNMEYMFLSSPMQTLDLSGFDTRNVTEMSDMFQGCSFAELKLGKNFIIANTCSIFSSPEDTLKMIGFGSDTIEEVLKISNPKERLVAVCDASNETPEPITIALLEEFGVYDMYLAMVSDSTINTIVCPQLADGVEVALAPASNHFYALADDESKAEVTKLSSETNGKTLKLYYRDTKTEVPPAINPDTPSETGVATDITMIVIALASILSLAVISTKKKRLAR